MNRSTSRPVSPSLARQAARWALRVRFCHADLATIFGGVAVMVNYGWLVGLVALLIATAVLDRVAKATGAYDNDDRE
jgi:hypothetical protein